MWIIAVKCGYLAVVCVWLFFGYVLVLVWLWFGFVSVIWIDNNLYNRGLWSVMKKQV